MDIRTLSMEEALQVRKHLMRVNADDEVVYPGDTDAAAHHLGLFIGVTPIGGASFLPADLPNRPGGFRLRGVSFEPSVQRKDIVHALIHRGLEDLSGLGASYVWCNARVTAVEFYLNLGFKPISDLFDIREIGLHRRMVHVLAVGMKAEAGSGAETEPGTSSTAPGQDEQGG